MNQVDRQAKTASRARRQTEGVPAPAAAADDSPLARLREAAARLADEERAGAPGAHAGQRPSAAPPPPPSRRRSEPEPARAWAPRPAPPPPRSEPAPPPVWAWPSSSPAYPPPASQAEAEPAQGWVAPAAASYPPPPPSGRVAAAPVGAPAAPAGGAGDRGSRAPLVIGIVAAVVVLVLVVGGLVVASRNSDELAPAAPPTTTVAERPVVPADTLYDVPGLAFGDLPEGSLDVARSPFDSLPDLQGMLKDLSGRTVLRSGTPYAVVLVYQFTEKFTSTPGYQEAFFEEIGGVGTDHQEATVAGQTALYYKVGSTVDALVVLKGNVAVLVQGPQPTPPSRLEPVGSGVLQNVS